MAHQALHLGTANLGPNAIHTILGREVMRNFRPTRLVISTDPQFSDGWGVSVTDLLVADRSQLAMSPIAIPVSAFSPEAIGNDLLLDLAKEGVSIKLGLSLSWYDPDPILRCQPRWRIIRRVRRWWRLGILGPNLRLPLAE